MSGQLLPQQRCLQLSIAARLGRSTPEMSQVVQQCGAPCNLGWRLHGRCPAEQLWRRTRKPE
eukprot:3619891-Karenia_brevis.AAC.1